MQIFYQPIILLTDVDRICFLNFNISSYNISDSQGEKKSFIEEAYSAKCVEISVINGSTAGPVGFLPFVQPAHVAFHRHYCSPLHHHRCHSRHRQGSHHWQVGVPVASKLWQCCVAQCRPWLCCTLLLDCICVQQHYSRPIRQREIHLLFLSPSMYHRL